jgi:hypothetical protein
MPSRKRNSGRLRLDDIASSALYLSRTNEDYGLGGRYPQVKSSVTTDREEAEEY